MPFLAIREWVPIHLADGSAVRDHVTVIMDAYRDAGFASFSLIEADTRQLGEQAAFTTVRWHATRRPSPRRGLRLRLWYCYVFVENT